MSGEELAAVMAAAAALLRRRATPPAESSRWRLAARLGALEAATLRRAARAASPWNASARLRG